MQTTLFGDDVMRTGLHPFERAGLGKAPFRLAYLAIGGSCCDYCGTGIVRQFWVQGADGSTFKVGCECVRKTGEADDALVRDVDDARKRADRLQSRERERQRYKRRFARLPLLDG